MSLIDLRANKGITGDNARTIAYAITAKYVNKTANTRINLDYVKQVIMSRWRHSLHTGHATIPTPKMVPTFTV